MASLLEFKPMKAAFIRQPGPPETIEFGDLPDPQPGPGQCLVKVSAVSVNPIDTYIRAGTVPMPLPNPFIVGCDLAGTVVETGSSVTRFKGGDRVWGSNQGLLGRQGTFSEYAAVDEQWLYPIPPEVMDEQAAAIALVGITAHLGLVREAKLKPGEIVFVNGGSGGVGSAVLQIAKALGARVITTAGSDAKADLCRKLGADLAINYKTEDVQSAIKSAAPSGVNVWWETLREPDFDRSFNFLARGGRMIVMAGREARPPFPVGPFYVKDLSLHGFVMFMATPEEQRIAAETMNRWMAEGKLKAHVGRRLPFSETAQAHRLQEENTIHKTGALSGKIVLKP
jgi:NADPH:quinone reductase